MSFLITVCDKIRRGITFTRLMVVLLFLATGCAPLTQQKQISQTIVSKSSEREEALPSVKPVTPPSASEPHKRVPSQEIEAHDNFKLDSTSIELE